jgi:hypothetical protein
MPDGDPIIIGLPAPYNYGRSTTYLVRQTFPLPPPPNTPTFAAGRNDDVDGPGIVGFSRTGVGVLGHVWAIAEDRPASGTGVIGRSLDGDGVIGVSDAARTGVAGSRPAGSASSAPPPPVVRSQPVSIPTSVCSV